MSAKRERDATARPSGLDYAKVELSSDPAENSTRPVAPGWKNWLHVGSEKPGPKAAAILPVVGSCRRIGLPVRQYSCGC